MGVKTQKVSQENSELEDDLSDVQVELPAQESSSMDQEKLAKLQAMMSKKDESKKSEEPKKKEEEVQIVEKKKRSLEFGVVGSGQAGARLAETFFRMGYESLAFNTASQDLEHIDLPGENKCLLEYGLGGASKDQSIGAEAAEMHRDYIAAKIKDKLGDTDVFFFCTSLGGGSGSGSIDTMIDVMSTLGKPIVVVTVLPMNNDDPQAKDNSLKSLKKLAEHTQKGRINNLIVVDNAKIESIFKDVSPMHFFRVSNEAIVHPLDAFNTYSTYSSPGMKVMDPMEFTKVLIDGEGLSLYGEMTVENFSEETALAEAVVSNLTSGLLAEGFNLEQTRYVGVLFVANERVWQQTPAVAINYALTMVQQHAGTAKAFHGIYTDDIEEDVFKVYSFFSGLALPEERIEVLKKEVAETRDTLKNKDERRSMSLNLDTGGNKVTNQVEEINEKIKAKKSPFAKFKQGLVDKRKK